MTRRTCHAIVFLVLSCTVWASTQPLSFRHETIDTDPPGNLLVLALVADLNNDARPDIIIGADNGESTLFWYENPTWTRHHIATSPQLEAGGAIGDVNGDGRPDIVCGQSWGGRQLYWFECPPDPTQPWTRHVIENRFDKYHDQAVADVDGDGKIEIITHTQNSRALVYYDIPADPAISPWYAYCKLVATELVKTEGLRIVDMDGDGKVDIVGGANIFRAPAAPGGAWSREQLITGYDSVRVAVGDLDGNGKLDVVISEGEIDAGRLVWLSQPGWEPHVLRSDLFHPHTLEVADLNGDALPDILVGEMGLGRNPSPKMIVFVNRGGGQFDEVVISQGIPVHEGKLADLNGDGKLDVVGKPFSPERHVDIWWNETNTEPPPPVDPQVPWATYMGGGGHEGAIAAAIAPDGGMFIVGDTNSPDFPAVNGRDTTWAGQYDVFVARFTPAGEVAWATLFGGAGDDRGYAIVLDPDGNVVIAGDTSSSDLATENASDRTYWGGYDPFIAKFTPAGELIWATYLEGSSRSGDFAMDVKTDQDGDLYVAGTSNGDAFVSKLAADGSKLWTTLLQGAGDDMGFCLAFAPDGGLMVTGATNSPDIATPGAFTPSYRGGISDAFVARLDADGSISWVSYLGGVNEDRGCELVCDAAGNTYVAGYTYSPNFPSSGGFDRLQWRGEGFVTKIDAAGQLVWSSFIGGSGDDMAYGLALDGAGMLVVVGGTASPDLPGSANSKPYAGVRDAFAARITPDAGLLWSAFIGGAKGDFAESLAIDVNDTIWLVGATSSADFPVLRAFQPNLRGNWDGFITCIFTRRTLTVESTPIPGAEVAGDRPGVTPYVALCGEGEIVSLTAPATVIASGTSYEFVRWMVDDVAEADGVREVAVEIAGDHRAVAVYQQQVQQTRTLAVQSSPIVGVAISGSRSGTTGYSAECAEAEAVSLTAPADFAAGGSSYRFIRWVVDGVDGQFGQSSLSITMDADCTAIAVYEPVQEQATLSVQSLPIGGIAIGGTRPGTTSYSHACEAGEVVTLLAPATATAGGIQYGFARWVVNGIRQPYGETELTVTMNGDQAVVGQWAASEGNQIIIEGPLDRGQTIPAANGGGTLTVNVYGQGYIDFAGIQIVLDFIDSAGCVSSAFTISTSGGNPEYGGMAVWHNAAVFTSVFPVFDQQMQAVGFTLLDYGMDLPNKTLLLTVNYDYTPGAFGVYVIDANAEHTEVGDSASMRLPFSVAPGSVAIDSETLHVRASAQGAAGQNGSVDAPFDSISKAVAAAGPATRLIKVAAGHYAEEVAVNGKPLRIEGGWNEAFAARNPRLYLSTLDSSGALSHVTRRPVTFTNSIGGAISGFTITRESGGSASGAGSGSASGWSGPGGYVASWLFDGNTLDQTGVSNAAAFGGTYVPGKHGQAISLNGTSDYVNCGNTAELNFEAEESFTISLWYKRSSLEVREQDLIAKQCTDWQGNRIGLAVWGGSGMKIYFGVGDHYKAYYAFGSYVNDTEWHHVAGVLDRATNTFRIYCDTAASAPVSIPAAFRVTPHTENMLIGCRNKLQGRYFHGVIDHVRAYKRALTGEEIAALFNEQPQQTSRIESGGAICCSGSTVSISDNVIRNHSAENGGAICCVDGSYIIERNEVIGNGAAVGGGICIADASATLRGNVIANNVAELDGGGLHLNRATNVQIINNTIAFNVSMAGPGGGILAAGTTAATIRNSILWGNSCQLALQAGSSVSVVWSDVAGGRPGVSLAGGASLAWGSGNIDADPLFADAIGGDYHLLSADGRWSSAQAAWLSDGQTSPCIDAGDPAAGYANEPQPDGFRVNAGTYGNTGEASRSRRWPLTGDATGDCSVSIVDIVYIRNLIGADPASGTNWRADVNKDGVINLLDMVLVRSVIGKRCQSGK